MGENTQDHQAMEGREPPTRMPSVDLLARGSPPVRQGNVAQKR